MEKSYERVLAEENAISRIQAMVIRLVAAKNINRTALAERMGVSLPRISQLLNGDPENISVRKVAALFHALDEELIITCSGIEKLDKVACERNALRSFSALSLPSTPLWRGAANGNDCCTSPERTLAA